MKCITAIISLPYYIISLFFFLLFIMWDIVFLSRHVKDLIILTSGVQILSLISNYFWLLWLLVSTLSKKSFIYSFHSILQKNYIHMRSFGHLFYGNYFKGTIERRLDALEANLGTMVFRRRTAARTTARRKTQESETLHSATLRNFIDTSQCNVKIPLYGWFNWVKNRLDKQGREELQAYFWYPRYWKHSAFNKYKTE